MPIRYICYKIVYMFMGVNKRTTQPAILEQVRVEREVARLSAKRGTVPAGKPRAAIDRRLDELRDLLD